MTKTLGALALVSLALLGTGCKKASPIVGKWTSSGQIETTEMEFKPENTFTMAIKVGAREFTVSGDYKIDGERLTITPKDVNVPGLSAEQLAKAKTQLAKPQDFTAKFPTDDQLTLRSATATPGSPGASTTLTRVKDAK